MWLPSDGHGHLLVQYFSLDHALVQVMNIVIMWTVSHLDLI